MAAAWTPWTNPAPFEPIEPATGIDVAAYLARIRYQGATSPSFTTLAGLQLAHLRTVPFENLDVLNRRPISIQPADLYAKIVTRRRGGFCYELNGLFATLLRRLGFQVTLLAATFPRPPGQVAPELDHLTLAVATDCGDGPWLVDVGAGRRAAATPLDLTPGRAQFDPVTGAGFRLDPEGEGLRLRRRHPNRPGVDWEPRYLLGPRPRSLAAFVAGVRHHESDPDSPFPKGLIYSRLTPTGRITISQRRLIITSGATRLERDLTDDSELQAMLRDQFGITETLNPG